MYPDFLVIGAQKAGTTWLDRNLRTHPKIWLPPEKEIHFFDLPRPLPFAALLLAPVRAARHWAKARLERDWAKVKAGEQSLGWYFRYYFLPRTHRWYRSLFTPSPAQICGEATPPYGVLPTNEIKRIHRLMPDLKIVYLLRDPMDRMWSDAAMFQSSRFGGRGMENAPGTEVASFLRDHRNLRHSRYAENLARWEQVFGPSQICLLFQDDIAHQPAHVLRAVTEFLGVAPAPIDIATLNRRINSKTYPPPDKATEMFLANELLDDLQALSKRMPHDHTRRWLERAENLTSPATVATRPFAAS
jgi:hypothetical protein